MSNDAVEGLPVHGYRSQAPYSVELVNQNKEAEEKILRMLDSLAARPDVDKWWLEIGRTAIEQGFMAVNRSIFQPTRVNLPS